MKARTKAKRRAKGGRPRLPDLERTPAGRIRRTIGQTTERAKAVTATVIEMRGRQHGANEANGKDAEWGYVLGRIYLDGNLGKVKSGGLAEMRLAAGNRYAEDIARYHSLTGIPFPSARAQDLFAVSGYDGEVSADRASAARRASNRMMALEGALLRCEQGRNVATTVKNICVMDIDEARGWPPHMHELLRRGLDALIFEIGLTSVSKS